MKNKKFVSIRTKIIIAFNMIAFITIIFSTVSIFGYISQKKVKLETKNLTNISNILSYNLIASISFDDFNSAKDILTSLKVDTSLDGAFIYDKNNQEFTSYTKDNINENKLKNIIQNDLTLFLKSSNRLIHYNYSNYIVISNKLFIDNEYLGVLVLIANKKDIIKTLKEVFLMLVIIFILLMFIIYYLSIQLQRKFTEPIFKLINIMKDITENHNYTIEIKNHSNDEFKILNDGFNMLIKTINEQTNELEKAIAKEKEAQKSKDQFLANMSHEIRTPINGIIGFTNILNDTKLNDKQSKYLETITQSSKLLLNVVNDILDYSKVANGKMDLDFISVNIIKELSMIEELYKGQTQIKGLNFITNIDQNIPNCLKCDENRLKQVLINLLGNAIKFTEKGSISLDIKLLDNSNNKATIRFSIKDTGIGIPKDKQQKIFESFSQADSSTTRKFGGTGLGLGISKYIISLFGGQIIINSTEGKGSEFYFILQLDICDDNLEDIEEDKILDNIYTNQSVLVAEDNLINQEIIKYLLEQKKIKVIMANDGKEALELYIQNNNIDLIFMDINMPIMGGIDATAKILEFERQNNIKHTPIIALTANTLAQDIKKYLSLGMDAHLAKPIDNQVLSNIISKYLKSNNKSIDVATIKYDKTKIANKIEIPKAMLDKLINIFFEDITDKVENLQKAIESNNTKQIAQIIHSIKGMSANLHIDKIVDLTKEAEKKSSQNNSYDYIKFINILKDLIKKYKTII